MLFLFLSVNVFTIHWYVFFLFVNSTTQRYSEGSGKISDMIIFTFTLRLLYLSNIPLVYDGSWKESHHLSKRVNKRQIFPENDFKRLSRVTNKNCSRIYKRSKKLGLGNGKNGGVKKTKMHKRQVNLNGFKVSKQPRK